MWESLGCGYIASYLKNYYHKEPLELQFFDGFFESDVTIVNGSVDSDFVGFSCTSPQMKHALQLAGEIKEQNLKVKTVFGGHHPSSLQSETLAYPQVDMVVAGEGEAGLSMILRQPKEKTIYLPPPIENLDIIPFPDRKLIHQERTLALTEQNDGERIASILSGRGCSFNCTFCTGDHDVFGKTVRKRSVNDVLDEIEQLVNEWNIDFLKFADTEINTSITWVKEFCNEKIQRRITIPFGCNIHTALINKSTLQLMKEANCREIWIGCESGSQKILKQMHKGVTVKMLENVFQWSKEVGLLRRAYFMVGFPSETREDFNMTLDLAERLEPDVLGCTILAPFPGTQIYETYKDKLSLQNVDWSSVDEYKNKIWKTENFSNEELHELQAEFAQKFKDRLCWRQKKPQKGY